MKRIVAFTGKMGSGKSTAIEILQGLVSRKVQLIKFAAPLYDIQNYVYARTGLEAPKPKDRKLLQWLGTDWGRSKDENLWVNLFERDARQALEDNPTSLIVCDDCRFDNEAQKLKDMQAIIVRIYTSDSARASRIQLENTTHVSEAGVDPRHIDYFIDNSGDREDLEAKVKDMLEEFNL